MKETEKQQHFFMMEAIKLGEKGRLTAPPNPWVGAVVVSNGEIVGTGYHVAPGLPHAEVHAIDQAGTRSENATIYVTLEPCSHYGKTPPCVKKIIEAKIAHVVIPFLDPDTKVAGQGVKILKDNGIKVTIGIGEKEAEKSLLPYLHHRKHRRPYVILKTAISLDGKTAAFDGSSKWITGTSARLDVQRLRSESGAILVGRKTAEIDQPSLTVRIETPPHFKPPLRVVLDPEGKLPLTGPLFEDKLAETIIATSEKCPQDKWEEYKRRNIEALKMDLPTLLDELARRGVLQLLVEGGAMTHTRFLEAHLADKLITYIGPCLLGEKGHPMHCLPSAQNMKDKFELQLEDVHLLDDTVRTSYYCLRSPTAGG